MLLYIIYKAHKRLLINLIKREVNYKLNLLIY
jgi:hypothetical protein